MLHLKITKEPVTLHSFVIHNSTKKSNYAQYLGFVEEVLPVKENEGSFVVVHWFYDKPILPGSTQCLSRYVNLHNLKHINVYYKEGSKQGELALSSHLALSNELKTKYQIAKSNVIFDPSDVDIIIHKKRVLSDDLIHIVSADLAYKYKLQSLDATVTKVETINGTTKYTIRIHDSLNTELTNIRRCDFKLLPQDEYVLVSVRCSHCNCFANKN